MKEQDLPFGNKIIGFDSPEEMLTYMAERDQAVVDAMPDLLEPQLGIGWGCYAIRMHPVSEDEMLAIFGYIFTEEEVSRQEIEAGAGIADGELGYIMERLRESHDRGYRFGTWASVVLPQGEYGDAHLMTLWPITEADYLSAQNNGWEMNMDLHARISNEVEEYTKGRNENEGDR